MSVLIVVAHPDDEVLGCGATAALLAARGLTVRACILSGQAAARRERPELEELHGDMHRAQQVLGLGEPVLGDFPNIKLNTVAHLDLVQFIEAAMLESGADVIFTHHTSDLNDDHVQTSRARTERPLAGGKNFHEVERFERRHIASSLGEACSRLAGTGSLHVVIIKIGRVVCKDHVRTGHCRRCEAASRG